MTAPELVLLQRLHDDVLAPLDGLIAESEVMTGLPQTLWEFAPAAEAHPGLMVWIGSIDAPFEVAAQGAGTTSSDADVTITVVVDAEAPDENAARAASIEMATEIRRAIAALTSADTQPWLADDAKHVRAWVSRSDTPAPRALERGGAMSITTLDVQFRTRLKAGR